MATFPPPAADRVLFDTLAEPHLHHLARLRAPFRPPISPTRDVTGALSARVLLQESIAGAVLIPKLGAGSYIIVNA
jgi:hypothetical protein